MDGRVRIPCQTRGALPLTSVPAALEAISAVIEGQQVRTFFQPVVELADRSVVGFEALSRGPAGTALESPLALIEAARAVGRLGELDWLCRVSAMEQAAAAGLPAGLSWFINVEPAGVREPCPPHLLPSLAQARSDLRVVLEVVERDINGHVTHLLHTADQARRDAWGVALDDVGAQDSSLALLPMLMPDVVKLDMSLIQQAPDPRAAAVTAWVRAYSERTGAVVLAEGVETEEHERLARTFGATFAQGYLYGRPGPLPSHLPAPRTVVPLGQHPRAMDGATPFEVASRHAEPHRATKRSVLHMSRHLEDRCERLDEPFVLLAGFQHTRHLGDRARGRYRDLSRRSALTVVVAEGAEPEQAPTFRVTGLVPGSRMRDEWVVVVVSAGFTAAFVGRDCGDRVADLDRRFDFVYTHDATVVAAIGRAFLQELVPAAQVARLADLTDPAPPARTRLRSLLRRAVPTA